MISNIDVIRSRREGGKSVRGEREERRESEIEGGGMELFRSSENEAQITNHNVESTKHKSPSTTTATTATTIDLLISILHHNNGQRRRPLRRFIQRRRHGRFNRRRQITTHCKKEGRRKEGSREKGCSW